MRKIAFILAVHFSVFSTQPLWQPLQEALFGDCGGSSCSAPAWACAAYPTLPGSPAEGDADQTKDGCCLPFQCCFPCCCYCQQMEALPAFAEGEGSDRPSDRTKTLQSACKGGPFQPPELA